MFRDFHPSNDPLNDHCIDDEAEDSTAERAEVLKQLGPRWAAMCSAHVRGSQLFVSNGAVAVNIKSENFIESEFENILKWSKMFMDVN